jgi:hypothetical protein
VIDKERLRCVADDMPLARNADKDGWNYLFDILRDIDQTVLDDLKPIKTETVNVADGDFFCEAVGFTELDRQPAEYRGRLVRITGRIIRCDKKTRFYESWILVSDKRDIPICVCSLEIPPELTDITQTAQLEKTLFVTVTGYFYKRRLCISDNFEEFTSPTILSKSFRLHPKNNAYNSKLVDNNIAKKQNRFISIEFILLLVFIFITWIICRNYFKQIFAKRHIVYPQTISTKITSVHNSNLNSEHVINVTENNIDTDSNNDNTNNDNDKIKSVSGNSHLSLLFFTAIIFVSIFVLGSWNSFATELDRIIDEDFTRNLFDMDEHTWREFSEEVGVSDQYRGELINFLCKLESMVSPLILRREAVSVIDSTMNQERINLSQLTTSPQKYKGRIYHFNGILKNVKKITLNQHEQNICNKPTLYLAILEIAGNGKVLVLSTFVPDGLVELTERSTDNFGKNTNITLDKNKNKNPDQNNVNVEQAGFVDQAGLFGIYVKRIRVGSEVLGVDLNGVDFGEVEYLPLVIAPKIQWFSDRNLIGRLGVDVGLFELVPSLSVCDLQDKELPISSSISLLNRADIIRRSFKLTDADREPFYSLLSALQKISVKELLSTADKFENDKQPVSTIELFNEPRKTRGRLVMLSGVAKRILPTLVEDKVVKELYGIERYYQIFLYAEGSREFPIVICVSSLPEGLQVGSGIDYNEQISVAAIPYKLWVYDTAVKVEGKETQKDQEIQKAIAVPLLIGKAVQWFPKKKIQNNPTKFINRTIIICIILLCIWILIKSIRPSQRKS